MVLHIRGNFRSVRLRFVSIHGHPSQGEKPRVRSCDAIIRSQHPNAQFLDLSLTAEAGSEAGAAARTMNRPKDCRQTNIIWRCIPISL